MNTHPQLQYSAVRHATSSNAITSNTNIIFAFLILRPLNINANLTNCFHIQNKWLPKNIKKREKYSGVAPLWQLPEEKRKKNTCRACMFVGKL